MQFALQWSWALGLCCLLWLHSVLPQHDMWNCFVLQMYYRGFCFRLAIIIGPSSLVLEGWAILTALLLSVQIPVFLKPDTIVSGWIDLYQACENKELNWSFVTTDPGLFVKYVWHTDDQWCLRAPKRLTSRGWVAWVVLGEMQKTITPSWAGPHRASGL